MERLVIPAPLVSSIRDAVLREDGQEWFAFGLCGQSGDRFLVTKVRTVDETDHVTKARGGCRVDPKVELSFLDECVGHRSRVPLLIHSHPFHSGGGVRFSHLDAEMMDSMTNWLEGAYPERGVGPLFAVLGEDSIRVARYESTPDGSGGVENIVELPVEIFGEWELERPLGRTDPTASASTDAAVDSERHDRTIRALTERGQVRLAGSRVGVVSAGGIGSVLVEQLTRLGVGELVVVDPDVVEESNLNRLYGARHDDIGREKVAVMADHAKSIDPSVEIETHAAPAQEVSDALRTCDLLVAGVDRISARMWLNEFAVRHYIPYVDAGTIIRTDGAGDAVTEMEGIVQTIVPGVTGCFACLDRGDPEQARVERLSDEELAAEVEDGYVEESVLTPEPAVVHLNSLVASKAVDAVVKLLTGFDDPSGLVRYEGLGNRLDAFRTQRATGCRVCSSDRLLGRGVPDHEASDLDQIATEPAEVELGDDLTARAAEATDVEMDDLVESAPAESELDDAEREDGAAPGQELDGSDHCPVTSSGVSDRVSGFVSRLDPTLAFLSLPQLTSLRGGSNQQPEPDTGDHYGSAEEVDDDGR